MGHCGVRFNWKSRGPRLSIINHEYIVFCDKHRAWESDTFLTESAYLTSKTSTVSIGVSRPLVSSLPVLPAQPLQVPCPCLLQRRTLFHILRHGTR